MSRRRAIVIGAGPAGLTAALELLRRSDVIPVVFEETPWVGGLSRTAEFKGNRMDIGGHRFFSKSDRVMEWWQKILPVAAPPNGEGPDPEQTDRVLLVRGRLSRILFLGKFFDYPITLSRRTLNNLGLSRVARILASYVRARLRPIHPEASLEDFFVNRFGRELYETFFRDYTEKIWGVPCRAIPPEWGAQRVKGLSVVAALAHAAGRLWRRPGGIAQKGSETSLIERFLYPKFGPGQLWEAVAAEVVERGGELRLGQRVTAVHCRDGRVGGVTATDVKTGRSERFEADAVFSTMPLRDLFSAFQPAVGGEARAAADGLVYRDFITVGVLLRGLRMGSPPEGRSSPVLVPDNWIYVQEPHVRLGRVQIFNNWSPYLVSDPSLAWLGLEYFCNEGDDLWRLDDVAMLALAVGELRTIGLIDEGAFVDGTVIRVPKAYPAYFGSYESFSVVREVADRIENLFLVGRNGMHRYNNMDHSMLAALTAVELYLRGDRDRAALWAVNSEQDYHESSN